MLLLKPFLCKKSIVGEKGGGKHVRCMNQGRGLLKDMLLFLDS